MKAPKFKYRFDNDALNKFNDKGSVYAVLAQTVGPLPFNVVVRNIGIFIETPNGSAVLMCPVNKDFIKDLEPYMQDKKPSTSVSAIASELIQKLKAGAFTETSEGIKINETCYLNFICQRNTPESVQTLRVYNGKTSRDDIFSRNDAQVLFHEYRQFKLAQERENKDRQNFIDSLGF